MLTNAPSRTMFLQIVMIGLLIALGACGDATARQVSTGDEQPPGWSSRGALDEAPAGIGQAAVIAGPDEPGERLIISGVVLLPDGVTPAAGYTMYVYQTDITGEYTRRGDETGLGLRHGRLRAWMRLGDDGRYEFSTIRPGSYPGMQEPEHIHVIIGGPGYAERYMDDYLFDDDPKLTARMRTRDVRGVGGPGAVLRPQRSQDGALRATRNFILPRHIRQSGD